MEQVARLDSLPDGKPVAVSHGDDEILLLRDGDRVRGFAAKCPHAGAPLQQAAVCDDKLVCPWHKAVFSLSDGALLEPPALVPLPRFEVRVEGNAVLVSAQPLPEAPLPPTDPADRRTMAIVGAGAAGTAAAAALREFGFGGRIVLVGDEPGDPYDRTALSKSVIGGQTPPEDTPPLLPPERWAALRVERLHDRVQRLDVDGAALHLAGGGTVRFDAVLLSPGSRARPLAVPGADRPGVHLLHDRADAAAILDATAGKPRVLVVGGGFIGLEAASALRGRGLPVTVVIPKPLPFALVLGDAVAERLKALHEENGVRFVVGEVAAIEGEPLHRVLLADGSRIAAELVLVGIGVTPDTGFAGSLELAEDGRLETDAAMRVSGSVFAAGDAARFPFGSGNAARIRVEHWRVAQQQARVAAAGMLGRQARFDRPPLFWTLHHGKRIEVHGHPDGFDRVEIDGDLREMAFVARQFRGDCLVGLVGCGRETELAALGLELAAEP